MCAFQYIVPLEGASGATGPEGGREGGREGEREGRREGSEKQCRRKVGRYGCQNDGLKGLDTMGRERGREGREGGRRREERGKG